MNDTTTIPLDWLLAILGVLFLLIVGLGIWAFKDNKAEHLYLRKQYHDLRNEVHKRLLELWQRLNTKG